MGVKKPISNDLVKKMAERGARCLEKIPQDILEREKLLNRYDSEFIKGMWWVKDNLTGIESSHNAKVHGIVDKVHAILVHKDMYGEK